MSDLHLYIDKYGHATEVGIAMYVEAMINDNMASLPDELFQKVRTDHQLRSEVVKLYLETVAETKNAAEADADNILNHILNDFDFLALLREEMDESSPKNAALEKRLAEVDKSSGPDFVATLDNEVFVDKIDISLPYSFDSPIFLSLIDHEENTVEEWTIPAEAAKIEVSTSEIPSGKYYFTVFVDHHVALGQLYLCSGDDAIDQYNRYRKG